MKLTDWCILFLVLGLCVWIPLDLRTAYLSRAYCVQQVYDRSLDRICEDSLMDAVVREEGAGSVVVDREKVVSRFQELLEMEFGVISESEKGKLLSSIRMLDFQNLQTALSMQQTDELRMEMEQVIREKTNPEHLYELYFPYLPGQDWYQNLSGPSLYTMLLPGDDSDPLKEYRRYVFSGGRIVKRVPEAGS